MTVVKHKHISNVAWLLLSFQVIGFNTDAPPLASRKRLVLHIPVAAISSSPMHQSFFFYHLGKPRARDSDFRFGKPAAGIDSGILGTSRNQ